VAEKFYTALIPEAREIAKKAAEQGKKTEAANVEKAIDDILARPEHQWFLGKADPLKDEHYKARIELLKKYNKE